MAIMIYSKMYTLAILVFIFSLPNSHSQYNQRGVVPNVYQTQTTRQYYPQTNRQTSNVYNTAPVSNTRFSQVPDGTVPDDAPIVFKDNKPDIVQYNSQAANRFSPTEKAPATTREVSPKAISNAVNAFSLKMLKILARSQTDNNIVMSPLSLSTILGLLEQGAQGPTLQQLEAALEMSKDSTKDAYTSILNSLVNRGFSKNSLGFSNALFVNKNFPIKQAFQSTAVKDFKVGVQQVDFRTPSVAASQINNWANTATRGFIPYIFSANSIDRNTDCLMANAVYFKGIWKSTFNVERTLTLPFQPRPGSDVNASFMHQSGRFPAGEDHRMGAKWLELPFDGSDFSMVFVLPIEQHGLDNLIERLQPSDLNTILNTRNHIKVTLGIPKFNVSYETSLLDTLRSMGIQDVFTPRSGLTEISAANRPLTITQAIQKSSISIDEQGSVAAVVTALAVNTLSLSSILDEYYFTANQPFLAIVVDKVQSVPLFIARISDPNLI